jgi:long-chain acyl-CoA synthetase
MENNFASYLARRARAYGDKIALIDYEGRSLTYSEFDARSSQFGRMLQAAGASKGDRVAVFMSNEIEFFEVTFGIWKAGMIAILINHRLTPEEVAYQIKDTAAAAIVVTPDLADIAESSNASLAPMILIDESYQDRLAGFDDSPFEVATNPDDPIVLAYTSGTTGSPKGAQQTHANWMWQLSAALIATGIRSDDRILTAGPLPYIGRALAYCALHQGAPIYILRNFEPHDVVRAIQDHQITATAAVPTMIYMMEELIESGSYDLTSLRTFWYGGAPISPTRLGRLLDTFGQIFVQSYGQTEAPSIAFLSREDHIAGNPRLGSAGRPAFSMEVGVRDVDGQQVSAGTVGEVWVRGGVAGTGYWNDAEKTRATIVGDWIRTGDFGYLDEEGYLFFADRRVDMILSGGHNVYPREVSDCISAMESVAEVAVVGLQDDTWGERVVAVIRVKDGRELTSESADEFCRMHLAGYKVPREYHFVADPLPKSGNGKVLLREIRESLATQ